MVKADSSSHRTVMVAGFTAVAGLLLAGSLSAAPAAAPGHYTRAQAAEGAIVFSATCQQCSTA